MSAVTRAISPSPVIKNISVSNVTEIATNYLILGLSLDAAIIFASIGPILYQSADEAVTFSPIHTFTGENVKGILLFADGEAGIMTEGKVFRSSGWAASKTSAAWTQVLTLNGTNPAFSWNRSSMGTNGVVITNEYGPHTVGGGDPADATAARLFKLSEDHGKNWRTVFDLYNDGNFPQPAGCHGHGSAYDEVNDRLWIDFGDWTGDGLKVAGAGNAQLAYSDERGAPGSWHFVTIASLGPEWAATTVFQWTTLHITPYGLLLQPDAGPGGSWTLPRTGYRSFGHPQVGPLRGGIIGEDVTQNPGSTLANPTPIFFGYAQGGINYFLAVSPDNGLTIYDIHQGPNAALYSGEPSAITVFGPTAGGNLIGNTTDPALKLFKAKLNIT